MQVILTTSNGSKVLTVKEQKRLEVVNKMLQDGVNPYESITTIAIGGEKDKAPTVKKQLSNEERLEKWLNTENLEIGAHKWSFIEQGPCLPYAKLMGPVCIACH